MPSKGPRWDLDDVTGKPPIRGLRFRGQVKNPIKQKGLSDYKTVVPKVPTTWTDRQIRLPTVVSPIRGLRRKFVGLERVTVGT